MVDGDGAPVRARWARLRFMIIGSLLANPPDKGELQERIQELADKPWEHPSTGEKVRFSFSTVERWFYAARGDEPDPFGKLARKTRKDSGLHPSVSVELGAALAEQYRDHRTWQYQLHYDNILVVAEQRAELGRVPSCTTVTRYMKDRGMLKEKKRKTKKPRALEPREKRSWEVMFANQLWLMRSAALCAVHRPIAFRGLMGARQALHNQTACNRARSRSGGRKAPGRSSGGTTDSSTLSLSVGSTRR